MGEACSRDNLAHPPIDVRTLDTISQSN